MKMQVFMVLLLFGYGILMIQDHFHHKLNHRFVDINFAVVGKNADGFEILRINAQVQQLQRQDQRNDTYNMFFTALHRTTMQFTYSPSCLRVKKRLKQ